MPDQLADELLGLAARSRGADGETLNEAVSLRRFATSTEPRDQAAAMQDVLRQAARRVEGKISQRQHPDADPGGAALALLGLHPGALFASHERRAELAARLMKIRPESLQKVRDGRSHEHRLMHLLAESIRREAFIRSPQTATEAFPRLRLLPYLSILNDAVFSYTECLVNEHVGVDVQPGHPRGFIPTDMRDRVMVHCIAIIRLCVLDDPRHFPDIVAFQSAMTLHELPEFGVEEERRLCYAAARYFRDDVAIAITLKSDEELISRRWRRLIETDDDGFGSTYIRVVGAGGSMQKAVASCWAEFAKATQTPEGYRHWLRPEPLLEYYMIRPPAEVLTLLQAQSADS